MRVHGRSKLAFYLQIFFFIIVHMVLFLCFTSFPSSFAQVSYAQTMQPEAMKEGRFFLVSIPSLSFLEWPVLNEEATHPMLPNLLSQGLAGSMNVRLPYRGLDDIYLSIGAGSPAESRVYLQGYKRDERCDDVSAEVLYERYSGLSTNHDIIVPYFNAAVQLNEDTPYLAVPGLLGEHLRQAGIDRIIFTDADHSSDCDNYESNRRFAPLMLMDFNGTVTYGETGTVLLQEDPGRPKGLKTNYKALMDQMELKLGKSSGSAQVVVIELMDLNRLYADRDYYSSEYFMALKNIVLTELGLFIQELRDMMNDHDAMLVFSPEVPTEAAEEKMMLTPLVLFINPDEWQDEAVHNSNTYLVTSDSTRRKGIVTYADIAPTVLRYFGIDQPSKMGGHPIRPISFESRHPAEASRTSETEELPVQENVPTQDDLQVQDDVQVQDDLQVQDDVQVQDDLQVQDEVHFQENESASEDVVEAFVNALPLPENMDYLSSELIQIREVYKLRIPLLYTFVIYEVVVLLLGLITSIKSLNVPRLPFMKPVLYSLMWAPVVMLWSGSLAKYPLVNTGFIIAMVTLLSLVSAKLPVRYAFVLTGLCTASSIILDGFGGGSLIQHSLLGYDPMIGARFYGIGNEFMGVLIGSTLLFSAAGMQLLYNRRKSKLLKIGFYFILSIFAGLVYYMIHPRLGTNAGGTITALASALWFGTKMFELVYEKKISIRKLLAICVIAVIIGSLALWLVNMFVVDASNQSHIGKAFHLLIQGDFEAIKGIIIRKLQMNMHLIGVSSWSKVFITAIIVLAVGLIRPLGIFKAWKEHMPLFVIGLSAVAIGALVALIFNDSGIVAAATLIIFAVAPMLILLISPEEGSAFE